MHSIHYNLNHPAMSCWQHLSCFWYNLDIIKNMIVPNPLTTTFSIESTFYIHGMSCLSLTWNMTWQRAIILLEFFGYCKLINIYSFHWTILLKFLERSWFLLPALMSVWVCVQFLVWAAHCPPVSNETGSQWLSVTSCSSSIPAQGLFHLYLA